MTYFFGCRRRRSYKQRRQSSCWRNPFVVFFLTFAAIGSLRFRVRTKQAATALIRKHRNRKKRQQQQQLHFRGIHRTGGVGSGSIMEGPRTKIVYTKSEEGKLPGGAAFTRFAATEQGSAKPVTVLKWSKLLGTDARSPEYVQELSSVLQKSPYKAYFFETKGVSPANASKQAFEFVLVDAPRLAAFAEGNPDPEAFRGHAHKCTPAEAPACRFRNLGGDATLIAPVQTKPLAPSVTAMGSVPVESKVYSHLAAFVRGAPAEEVNAVWKLACRTFFEFVQGRRNSPELANKPVWFSTSGTGIAWLHLRLDSRPKYYQFKPFAKER